MKSKNLDYKMSKQSLQHIYNQKKNRKQTKPKRNNKIYPAQQNDTESDNNNFSPKKSKKYKNVELKNDHLKRTQKMRCSITQQSNTSNHQQGSQKNINKSKVLKIAQKRNSQNFIGELNSYLHELKRSKLNLNQMGVYTDISKSKTLQIPLKSSKNQKQQLLNENQNTLVVINSDRLQKKIKKQKTINLNLQKCIIEIQKVLWQRNQKLQALQQQLHRKSHLKLNYSKNMNQIDRNNLGKTIFFNRDLTSKSQQIPKLRKNIIYKEQYYPEQQSSMNEVSKISSRRNADHESAENYHQKQQKKTDLQRLKQKRYTDLTRFKLKQDQLFKFREKRINKKTQRFDNNDDLYLKNNIQWKEFDQSRRQKSYNKFQKHQHFF